jgi:hypothetical protein
MSAWLAADKREVRVPGLISGAAARAKERNNMKQIAIDMHNYASSYKWIPRGATFDSVRARTSWMGSKVTDLLWLFRLRFGLGTTLG